MQVFRTYSDWITKGRYVVKGEKSYAKISKNGEPLFEKSQTKQSQTKQSKTKKLYVKQKYEYDDDYIYSKGCNTDNSCYDDYSDTGVGQYYF